MRVLRNTIYPTACRYSYQMLHDIKQANALFILLNYLYSRLSFLV